jgi:hypothetical protein
LILKYICINKNTNKMVKELINEFIKESFEKVDNILFIYNNGNIYHRIILFIFIILYIMLFI